MLKERFPDARIVRMDQDTTSQKGAVIKILKSIRNRTVDIVVGTQMLAKGHDFPSITLVGVVCADLSLSLPDFRAGERTFQLLAQVAGRAGRGDTPGKVIMQTYNPDHFIIEASQKQDFQEFFHNEAPFRKALMYPPFSRMTQLKISGSNSETVKLYAETVAEILKDLLEKEGPLRVSIQVLGPAEAPIQKISSKFRWQILIKSPSAGFVNRLVKATLEHPQAKPKSGMSLSVDVDPYFLM
jgi:primosomal protein N' (replication factor Y)